jgi:hypothetical protein
MSTQIAKQIAESAKILLTSYADPTTRKTITNQVCMFMKNEISNDLNYDGSYWKGQDVVDAAVELGYITPVLSNYANKDMFGDNRQRTMYVSSEFEDYRVLS